MAPRINTDQTETYLHRFVLRYGTGKGCGLEGTPHPLSHRTELTEQRCHEIARLNGHMTTEQVRVALSQGQRVYSNFSYFVLEA